MDTDNLPVGTHIEHEKYGEGIISENNAMTYKIIFVRGGEIEFSKLNVELNVLERAETDDDQPKLNIREVERMLTHVGVQLYCLRRRSMFSM